jgi:FkbM family methyltransferase
MIRTTLLTATIALLGLTSPLNGLDEEIDFDQSLNIIYNQGFCLFHYALPTLQNSPLYSKEGEYVDQFPFTNYKIYSVDDLGMFYIDKQDVIKDCLRNNSPWESGLIKMMKLFIKPGTTAIDIGAHIGTHTITMSNCVGPEGYVVAFEPHRKIFRELCMNLSLNDCTNVYPIRCAIGKTKGIVNLVYANPYNEGGTFALNDEDGNSALLPLDSFDFINISFIKIDVANMEEEVLKGAIETIRGNRPAILLEIQGSPERTQLLHEDDEKKKAYVIDLLEQLGYDVTYLNDPSAPNAYFALPRTRKANF